MMDDKCDHPNCMQCRQGVGAAIAWECQTLETHGFYVHATPVPNEDFFLNVHTHGFTTSWNHPDMQIVIGIDPNISASILWRCAHLIKGGEQFDGDPNVDVVNILEYIPVRIISTTEDSRPVLRIILPDENNLFPGSDECDPLWARQENLNTD